MDEQTERFSVMLVSPCQTETSYVRLSRYALLFYTDTHTCTLLLYRFCHSLEECLVLLQSVVNCKLTYLDHWVMCTSRNGTLVRISEFVKAAAAINIRLEVCPCYLSISTTSNHVLLEMLAIGSLE